jgi:hypothetical protein
MPVAGGEKSYTNVDFGDTNRVMAVLIAGHRGLFLHRSFNRKGRRAFGIQSCSSTSPPTG